MSSRDPIPTIRQRLSSARVELALASVIRSVAIALWQWLLLAALVVAFDSFWPVGPSVRFVFAVALVVGLVRVVWRLIPPRLLRRASPWRLAREIEQRCNLLHNPLITALQLQVAPSAAGPQDVKSLLLTRSAQRGEDAAHATESSRLSDRRARSRSLLALLAAVVVVFAAGFIAPRPIDAVTMRLIDPWGDHPPYTSLVFEIAFEPDVSQIVYGGNARCTVHITGGVAPHADLVVRNPHDRSAEPFRLPLQRAESAGREQHFAANLRDCRALMQVMVQTPAGRSEWLTIKPLQVPRWASRTLTIRGPQYAPVQPARRLPLPDNPEPMRMIQGSRLTVEATSTLPLSAMQVAGAPSPIATLSDDARQATWNWTASATGSHKINLTLIGPTDLPSTTTRLRIHVVPDSPPDMSISQPPPRAAALPDQRFTARLDALDDVSIRSMTLSASVLRDGEVVEQRDQDVSTLQNTGDRGTAGVPIDLSQLDLRPGDTVRLQATARDDRPAELGGPQSSQPATSDILIIDEETYAAMAGHSAGGAEQGESGDQPGQSGEAPEGDRQPQSAPGQADATGKAPGEGGAPIDSAGQSGKHIDGSTQGNQPSQAMPGQAAGHGNAPAPSAGASDPSPGGDGSSADSHSNASPLLDQTRNRPLINRDGTVEPIAGRTDPDGPRRHATALDEGGALPEIAASRSSVRSPQRSSSDDSNPLAAIPARYRDLAARYFRRLAEQDAAPTQEPRDHE